MAPPVPPQLLLAGAGAIAAYLAFRPGKKLPQRRPPAGQSATLPSSFVERWAPEQKRLSPANPTERRASSSLVQFAPERKRLATPAPFAHRDTAIPWADMIRDMLEPSESGVAARVLLQEAQAEAERTGNWGILSAAVRTAAAVGAVDGVQIDSPEAIDAVVYVLMSRDWNWDLTDQEHRKLVGKVFGAAWHGPMGEFAANTLKSCTHKYAPEDRPYYEIIGYRRNRDPSRKLCEDKLNEINNAWQVLWSHGGPMQAPWPYMTRYMRMMVQGRSAHYRGGPAAKPGVPGWVKAFAVVVTSAAAGPGVGLAVGSQLYG